jgi:hypothetical protein
MLRVIINRQLDARETAFLRRDRSNRSCASMSRHDGGN